MKISLTIFTLFLTSICFSQNENNIEKEIYAINDVLETIILKESPGNPYNGFNEFPPPYSNAEKQDSLSIHQQVISHNHHLDSMVYVLYIPNRMLSLKDTISEHKWLYRNDKFEPIYKELINSKNFKSLKSEKFTAKKLTNIWRYKLIEHPADSIMYNSKYHYLNLNISRVCFNEDESLGFFYIEVLTSGENGYVSLILIEKRKSQNEKWKFVNGTYYN